jgi:3-carboxy-cis,cis-muconate cycloisomerase
MVMAEAVMIALSRRLGRLRAHELVSAACRSARACDVSLAEALSNSLDPADRDFVGPLDVLLDPKGYLGEADGIVNSALNGWDERWSQPATGDFETERR